MVVENTICLKTNILQLKFDTNFMMTHIMKDKYSVE